MSQVTASSPQHRLNTVLKELHSVQLGSKLGVAIFTAWRATNSRDENEAALSLLKRNLRSMGFGYRQVEGQGQEEAQDPQDPTKKVILTVTEPSLVVTDITLEVVQFLWVAKKQWGVVYAGAETGWKPKLMGVGLRWQPQWRGGDFTIRSQNARTTHPRQTVVQDRYPRHQEPRLTQQKHRCWFLAPIRRGGGGYREPFQTCKAVPAPVPPKAGRAVCKEVTQ